MSTLSDSELNGWWLSTEENSICIAYLKCSFEICISNRHTLTDSHRVSYNQIIWILCPSQVVMKLILSCPHFLRVLINDHIFPRNIPFFRHLWQAKTIMHDKICPGNELGKKTKWSSKHISVFSEPKSKFCSEQVDVKWVSRKCTSRKRCVGCT